MFGTFAFLIISLCSRASGIADNKLNYNSEQIFRIPLDQANRITLDWKIDYADENLLFEVHLPSEFGWFAFGFSDRGDFFPADYCVLWYNWKRNLQFQDAFADETGVLSLDVQQDCTDFKIKRQGHITKFTFQRKFDTCDENDYIIEDGTTHIVWCKGNGPLYQINGLNVSAPTKDRNMVRAQLLKNDRIFPSSPHGSQKLDILVENVKVPGDETTYWCHVHKLPESYAKKHHVLQYEAVIHEGNEGLVHHMEVFRCIAPVGEEIASYAGSCFATDRPPQTQVCKRVLAAWAMGAKPFTYPQQAGLPIGGEDFNPFVMLEVHYNNPQMKSGLIDNSGIRFHVTSNLRPMDAGVIELGLEYTDKLAIPPRQPAFSLTGYCVSACTAVSLPPEGILVFGSQLHTHLTGIRVWTRHVRNGRELPELNRDNHYSTHFQEIRRLKRNVLILPGDALITSCDYATDNRENVTLGGFAISDEMCVNYIHYYPATKLEVCKSTISDQALMTYFDYMELWENQPTSKFKPISENYRSIRWNPMRVQLLDDVYREAPLSMQCNMSSGDRFPGYWENTPLTPVLMPLPPPVRHCKH